MPPTHKAAEALPRSQRGAEAGFTVIELLITLGVSMICLAGLLSLHTAIARGNQSGSRSSEAVTAAELTLEEARQMSFTAIQATYGALPIETDLEPVVGRNDNSYRRELHIEDVPGVDLVRVRVVVAWTDSDAEPGADDGAHDHQVALEVLRTREELL